MRLWHEALIPYLPRQQLLGLHREICALRGNGWGRKHATVDYVFEHPYGWLVAYHYRVLDEMENRGYWPNFAWDDAEYRGKNCPALEGREALTQYDEADTAYRERIPIYPEHDDAYLKECLENLAQKGIKIDMEE